MFRLLNLIINKGLALETVSFMLFNLSISFFPLAAPLALFFSIIFVLGRMSEDSEIIALRSFGFSKFKLFFPFLLTSVIISLTLQSIIGELIPKANADFKNTIVKLTSTGMLSSIKSGQFFTDIPKLTLFAKNVTEDGNGFEHVYLHIRDTNKGFERVILAQSGSLVKIFADLWHAPNLRLHLQDGNIVEFQEGMTKIQKIKFKEYDFPIFSSDFSLNLLDKDSMKTNAELQEVLGQKLNLWKSAAPDKAKENKVNYYKTLNEYLSRFATFTQMQVFTLLAFCFGIKKGRGKSKNSTGKAILLMLAYYVTYFVLLGVAQKGGLSPYIANFLPAVLLGLVLIYYWRQLDWAQ